MTHQLGHILFQSALGLFSAAGILVLIDYYIFSWIGVFLHLIKFCKYKEVSECFSYKIKRLSSPVDIERICRVMMIDESRTIHFANRGQIVIRRKFGKVIYQIRIYHNGNFGFTNYISDDIDEFLPEKGGEKYWKPNYFIRRHVYQTVNDLPITKAQKRELKRSVWILPVADFNIKLF